MSTQRFDDIRRAASCAARIMLKIRRHGLVIETIEYQSYPSNDTIFGACMQHVSARDGGVYWSTYDADGNKTATGCEG